MIKKEVLLKAAKEAKDRGGYLFLLQSTDGLELKEVAVSITDHWFGSKRVEFISEEYTFDNIKDNKKVLKVLIPDDIIKDTSLSITVGHLNQLMI